MAFTKSLILAIIVGGAIAGCHQTVDVHTTISNTPFAPSSATSADCRTIQHPSGETEICGQPQRIVVLGPYVLESLLALEVQPIGFADHIAVHQGDYDNPSQQIPYLGSRIMHPLANVGLAYTPSLEAILKIKPDLILGLDSNADQYEVLSKIAPTLLLKWADTEMNLRTIGQAVERSEQAERLLTEMAQRIAAARTTFAPLVATHPKVMLLSSSQFEEINLGNTAHGLCSSLIEALGFQLVSPPGFDDIKSASLTPISLETLPQLNDADLVILLGSNFNELKQLNETEHFEEYQLSNLKQAWEANAIAQSLEASKAGRVYFIPAYLCLGLPGPIGTELYLNELKARILATDR